MIHVLTNRYTINNRLKQSYISNRYNSIIQSEQHIEDINNIDIINFNELNELTQFKYESDVIKLTPSLVNKFRRLIQLTENNSQYLEFNEILKHFDLSLEDISLYKLRSIYVDHRLELDNTNELMTNTYLELKFKWKSYSNEQTRDLKLDINNVASSIRISYTYLKLVNMYL